MLLTTDKKQESEWTTHFKKALNKDKPDEPVYTQRATAYLDIDTNPSSKQEIISAIKALKNGKTPGLDNVNTELFKADPNLAAEIPLRVDIIFIVSMTKFVIGSFLSLKYDHVDVLYLMFIAMTFYNSRLVGCIHFTTTTGVHFVLSLLFKF